MSLSPTYALGALLLLAGCATAPLPSFPITHPANPTAAEANPAPVPSLAPDAASLRTAELLNPH